MMDLSLLALPTAEDLENMGRVVCVMCGATKCKRPVVLSEEVYWWLCQRKVELHVHSLDEVLRIELQARMNKNADHPFAKSLIHEGIHVVNTDD